MIIYPKFKTPTVEVVVDFPWEKTANNSGGNMALMSFGIAGNTLTRS